MAAASDTLLALIYSYPLFAVAILTLFVRSGRRRILSAASR